MLDAKPEFDDEEDLDEPIPNFVDDEKQEPIIKELDPPKAFDLPKGVLRQGDSFLVHPASLLHRIAQGENLHPISRAAFFITVVMGAAYGAVMGGSNWLQGSPIPWGTEFLIMLSTAVKVPCLFLITLAIVVPPIYVSSTFVGAKVKFDQMVALLLVSLAVTATTLASMASVAFFFSITTTSYTFIKVLHVTFFAYAGLAGLTYLTRGFNRIVGTKQGNSPMGLFTAWLLLYMFVGTQLAWVMRPFVGEPNMQFTLFRPREGNFYENMWTSFWSLIEFGPILD